MREPLQGLTAGSEVVIQHGRYGPREYTLAKIKRVTPAGNYVVPFGGGTVLFNAFGIEKGANIWHRKEILPPTPELRERIDAESTKARLLAQIAATKWTELPALVLCGVVELVKAAEKFKAEGSGRETP